MWSPRDLPCSPPQHFPLLKCTTHQDQALNSSPATVALDQLHERRVRSKEEAPLILVVTKRTKKWTAFFTFLFSSVKLHLVLDVQNVVDQLFLVTWSQIPELKRNARQLLRLIAVRELPAPGSRAVDHLGVFFGCCCEHPQEVTLLFKGSCPMGLGLLSFTSGFIIS